MQVLGDAERKVLAAVCDTVVPSIEREPDPDGFWARSATGMGIHLGVEELINGIPDEILRAGLAQLLDAIGAQGILRSPSQESREQILRNIALSGPEPAAGIAALIGMTLFITYGAPDARTGQNVNWQVFDYPGPISPPPDEPKTLEVHVPEGEETIEADVCIVGSGAGGSVIAATLAERGLDVVVLDAAGYFNESDFAQLEFKAYQEMYWRGGPTPTADGNVSLVSGTTLGGGTTINWTNCLRTKHWVREQWAREHGLDGVDGPDFDGHLDAVWARLGVTDSCSDLNGPQQRMAEACEALGWSFKRITRNTDLDSYDPESAGYIGFGDQSGSKRSADRTWLADAQANGARLIADTRADEGPGRGRPRRRRRGSARLAGSRGPHIAGDGARPARRGRVRRRSSRRRCCCARGSAARRPATIFACTRPPRSSASTARTSRRGGARRRRRSATSSSMPSDGLRPVDRDGPVRAGADRLGDALDLGA